MDGFNYGIIGTLDLKPEPLDVLAEYIDEIYEKYGLLSSDGNGTFESTRIGELFKSSHKSYEGTRHVDLLSIMNSLIARNHKILSEEQIKKIAFQWNLDCCLPPLDERI